jgi:hypothetical protein
MTVSKISLFIFCKSLQDILWIFGYWVFIIRNLNNSKSTNQIPVVIYPLRFQSFLLPKGDTHLFLIF